MKNFKLLLASTAILSTGLATAVIADDEPSTTTLNVSVEIAVVDEVIPIQDIDFGTLVVSPSDIGQQFNVSMDPATSYVGYPAEKMLGKTKNGQVSLTMKDDAIRTISLPNTIPLRNHEGAYLWFDPSFAQIGENIKLNVSYVRKVYGIGGTLHPHAEGLSAGMFTGELTVTVIADEG